MQIFVRSPSGRMISLKVDPDEALCDVKKKIMEKHNLVFDGVRMNNDYRTMADYNIKHQSTLDLYEKMQIHVRETLRGFTFTMDVDSSYTIDDVKHKIEVANGSPKGRQCLIFASEQLEGKRTLADYNICNDSSLLLVLHPCPCPEGRMQIFMSVPPTGKTVTLNVESLDTINSIKMKICEMEGIRPRDHLIIFNGRPLQETLTLSYYDVQNDSELDMVLRHSGS